VWRDDVGLSAWADLPGFSLRRFVESAATGKTTLLDRLPVWRLYLNDYLDNESTWRRPPSFGCCSISYLSRVPVARLE